MLLGLKTGTCCWETYMYIVLLGLETETETGTNLWFKNLENKKKLFKKMIILDGIY